MQEEKVGGSKSRLPKTRDSVQKRKRKENSKSKKSWRYGSRCLAPANQFCGPAFKLQYCPLPTKKKKKKKKILGYTLLPKLFPSLGYLIGENIITKRILNVFD
jgi:hypothetical protein